MLQLLDDGRVTDSKGNVVNFCNCVVIFTSNVGSQTILDVSSSEGDGVREVGQIDLRLFNLLGSSAHRFTRNQARLFASFPDQNRECSGGKAQPAAVASKMVSCNANAS